jgi:hypothetical protein
MSPLNKDQIYFQDFKQVYEKQKYITDNLNEIDSFLSNHNSISLDNTLYLSNYLVEAQSVYANSPTRFNSYQEIIDVLEIYNYASKLYQYQSAPIEASKFVGQFIADQIDYIYKSQLIGNAEVSLIGKFLPSQINGIYASNLQNLLQNSIFDSLYVSNIIGYIVKDIYVSDIEGLIESSQIFAIYASQIQNLLKSNQISRIYASQVTDIEISSQISDITGGLVKISQIDQDLLTSSKEVTASFTEVGYWATKDPAFKSLYFCGNDNRQSVLELSMSSDPNDYVQAIVYCTLLSKIRGSSLGTLYYTYNENGCSAIDANPNDGYVTSSVSAFNMLQYCPSYLLGLSDCGTGNPFSYCEPSPVPSPTPSPSPAPNPL